MNQQRHSSWEKWEVQTFTFFSLPVYVCVCVCVIHAREWIVCVCVFISMQMYVCMSISRWPFPCLHEYVEAQCWCWVWSSITLHNIKWDQDSLNLKLADLPGLVSQISPWSLPLFPLLLDFQTGLHACSVFVWMLEIPNLILKLAQLALYPLSHLPSPGISIEKKKILFPG